jgi:hypothetical protein
MLSRETSPAGLGDAPAAGAGPKSWLVIQIDEASQGRQLAIMTRDGQLIS